VLFFVLSTTILLPFNIYAITLLYTATDYFNLSYFEVDWILEQEYLVCKNTHIAHLFLSNPMELYINWAAAMQIQFHVCNLKQIFRGTRQEWTKEYLKHFIVQATKCSNDMITKFVKPFEKYIK